jgi:hypothetical protein
MKIKAGNDTVKNVKATSKRRTSKRRRATYNETTRQRLQFAVLV